MKKFLGELAWAFLAMVCANVWVDLFRWADSWQQYLIAIPLSLIPLSGMVIGFRKGYPDGIWGIK